MEIIRKKLLDLSNTSNISDSYESLEDSSLEVDEQRENYHQSEIKPSAEGNEAEHGHCHRKYLSDHGKVDVATSTFPPSPQVCPCRIQVNKMAAQMQELRLKVDNLAMASEPSYQELTQRIKMLENERDSLLTALRLLNNEAQCTENLHQSTPSSSVTSSSPSLSSPRDNPTWSVVESSKRRRNKKKNHQQVTGDSRPANQPTIQAENASNDQRGESTRSSKSVVILGDSMTKNIHGGKLSREAHVTLRSFSGSTVDDMIDFVRPFTRRKPDELILHIGTNDLKGEEPQQVAEKIVNLGLSIERETPSTKLTLSGIINRSDDQGRNRKVPKVNKALRSFCNSNGWKFLSNENIDSSCLNSGGLHLNRRGVYKLAGNFREVINGNWVTIDAEIERPTPVNQGPFQSIQNVRGFKIGSLNIASLCKHFDELCIVTENQPFDILAINETRLDMSIPDSLIHLPGYSLSRFARNRNGGGVCAYIRSSINFRRRTSLESDNLELLALEVNKPNSKPFLVYCW